MASLAQERADILPKCKLILQIQGHLGCQTVTDTVWSNRLHSIKDITVLNFTMTFNKHSMKTFSDTK